MKNKFITLLAIFSLITPSGNLMAKERRGAMLIVQKRDWQLIKGELIAVKEKSLLLLDAETGADVSIDIEDVWTIKIVRKSGAWVGGYIGVILGLVIGYKVGYPLGSETGFIYSKEEAGRIGLAIGGLIGAGIGAGIGALVTADKKIAFYGKNEEEINEALEYLRKKARIPDYQ